jgi:MFS family permease
VTSREASAAEGAAPGAADEARPQAGPQRRFAALRNRNFALLWFGLIISNSGSWMQVVAQGWLVYELTGSPFYLGVVGFARAVSMIVLPPMGGVIADRVSRLQFLKVTQVASFLLALLLAILVSTGLVQVWQIIALSFLTGVVSAFDQPTRQALVPDLVRREDLTSAIALNSAAWQGAGLFGPALAGLTVALIGLSGAFYANAISYLAVVVAVFLMRGVPERAGGRPRRGLFDDLFEGLRYVRATQVVLVLLLMAAVTSVFGKSYQQLLPVFAKDTLSVGTSGLGFLMSAPGAGTLVGASLLAWAGDIRRKGVLLYAAMLLFSGFIIAFTFSRSFAASMALLFLSGVAATTFSILLTTMLQLRVPGQMRGRVLSLITVAMQGLSPLGAVMTGAIATATGTPPAVALTAAVIVIAVLVALPLAPGVRRFA